MAKKIDCDKFLVIETSKNECFAMCDSCNVHSEKGYYVAVLNTWYCPKCFQDWKERAKWYQEDAKMEQRNYEIYAKKLRIKQ